VADRRTVGDVQDLGGVASTPPPPYVAVIFTSVRNAGDEKAYAEMAARMAALVEGQAGFLGVEAARESVGITVSYWQDEACARAWKQVAEHLLAQQLGRTTWYADYRVRVATVERDYGPEG
jgi:heme-degrading monooxygenase HmoA